MKRIAILASGTGTNTENLIRYFHSSPDFRVTLVLSNKSKALVLEKAKKLNVPALSFTSSQLKETGEVLQILKKHHIDIIILAGFLQLVPIPLIKAFPNHILNIHPALLPKYGGKGMFGSRVHETVIAAGDKESGITIHYVTEKYDEGGIILQKRCPIFPDDTADSLAQRIHQLEYTYYPKVIENLFGS